MHYNYIAIEGNIGAGKTTLASRIAADFRGKLILEQFEDNSFLPKFYKDPGKYAFPLEMSFLADRYQQLKDQIASHDLFSRFFISDYFINKSLIFSRKNLEPAEYKLYYQFFNIINSSLPKPDLLVYLHVSVERLQQNIEKRGRDYEKLIQATYLEKIQESYLDYLRQREDMRILILDTNNIDFVDNEMDYKKLVKVINKGYPKGIHRDYLD